MIGYSNIINKIRMLFKNFTITTKQKLYYFDRCRGTLFDSHLGHFVPIPNRPFDSLISHRNRETTCTTFPWNGGVIQRLF